MRANRAPQPMLWMLACVCACQPGQPGGAESTSTESTSGESTSSASTSDGSTSSDDGSVSDTLGDTTETTTTTDDTTTSDTDDACTPQDNFDCTNPLEAEYVACLAACPQPALTCAEESCRFDCEVQQIDALWACEAPDCPHPPWDYGACVYPCYVEALDCTQAPDCSPRSCTFDAMACTYVNEGCNCQGFDLYFPYAGSCELMLPGPAPETATVYTEISSMGMSANIAPSSSTCDNNPSIDAHWADDTYDRIIVCPDLCQAFALDGVIRVTFEGSACE